MPPTYMEASACTMAMGSVGANQRSPGSPQIRCSRSGASSPATLARIACAIASWRAGSGLAGGMVRLCVARRRAAIHSAVGEQVISREQATAEIVLHTSPR